MNNDTFLVFIYLPICFGYLFKYTLKYLLIICLITVQNLTFADRCVLYKYLNLYF